MTPEQARKYVKDYGYHCPYCLSPRIINVGTTYGLGTRHQKVKCDRCGKFWIETYGLVNVT